VTTISSLNHTRVRRRRIWRSGVSSVAVAVALVLSACSGPATEAGPEATDAIDYEQYIGAPDPAICGDREYRFGYNTFSDTEEFAVQLWEGIQRVAEELGCVEVTKLSDNADPSVAVQNAQVFVQQDVDGALLFNVLEAAGPGQVQVLQQAGIPAVTIVVESPDETFVTNDDSADGLSAGTALGEAYNALDSDGPVYALIGRFDGQGVTGIERMDGIVEGLEQTVPDIQIEEFETNADPPTAQSGAAAILSTIPADATILMSGINGGIVNSMLQAARQVGVADRVLAASMATVNPSGLQYICENPEYIGGQAFFPETWADYMLPALIARVNGAEIEHKYVVPTGFIGRDEISDFYPDFTCAS
jgi:ribose transport system substrate-binding protein